MYFLVLKCGVSNRARIRRWRRVSSECCCCCCYIHTAGQGCEAASPEPPMGHIGRARLGLFYAIDTCPIATYLANLARRRVALWSSLICIPLTAVWRAVSVGVRWAAGAAVSIRGLNQVRCRCMAPWGQGVRARVRNQF